MERQLANAAWPHIYLWHTPAASSQEQLFWSDKMIGRRAPDAVIRYNRSDLSNDVGDGGRKFM